MLAGNLFMIVERLPPHISETGKFKYVIACVINVSLDFLSRKPTQIQYDIIELI